MLIPILLLISIIAAVLAFALGLALWQALLVFAGCYLLANIIYVLWALMTSLRVKDMEKPIEKADSVCRFATMTVFGLLCSYMGIRTEIEGMEKLPEDGRFLLVCNHRSGFDPVVLMHRLRKYELSCIAKPSIMKLPFIGRVAYGIGCLGIDRENDRNALKTILTAANYLKKDVCSVCIFPEGTRSRSGDMLPFHAGSFKIAQRANAPVAVVSISGTEMVSKNVLRRRSPVKIKVLELVPAEQVKAMATQELAEYSRKLIAGSLSEVKA